MTDTHMPKQVSYINVMARNAIESWQSCNVCEYGGKLACKLASFWNISLTVRFRSTLKSNNGKVSTQKNFLIVNVLTKV